VYVSFGSIADSDLGEMKGRFKPTAVIPAENTKDGNLSENGH
jgi:hypothetical protein